MKLDREKVYLAMARKCMSRRDIVEAGLDMTKGNLSRILRGGATTPETAGKIARILEVDITEILLK